MLHRILLILVSTLVHQVSWSRVCTVDWENSSPTLQAQPSCPFDALCTCSSPGPILGVVQCLDSPLDTLPNLNSSKVFMLRLENNGLRVMDEARFVDTGIWRLQIRHNLITRISEGTFNGLQHSLQELDLRHNRLYFFPRAAVRSLARLRELDLTGNLILSVKRADFVGLERSLKKLVLRCNALTSLDRDTFTDLIALEWLDLSENRLSFVAETSFQSGSTPRLRHFNLADNALSVIPYGVLALMKSLRTADLSRNRISSVATITDTKDGIDATVSAALLQMSGGLKLESLNLNDNQIETLSPKSFRHFKSIKHLSLSGNPLKAVLEDAFLGTTIEELDMRACDLESLSPYSFAGQKDTLRLVDLAHNPLNGSAVEKALANMTSLVNVSLEGNVRSTFDLARSLSSSAQTLQELHLESSEGRSPNLNGFQLADLEQLKNFTRLRIFGISHFPRTSATTATTFQHLSPTIELIVLKSSNLKMMDQDCFRHTPRLKRLDISSNQLVHLDKNVFKTVGRSMETLTMAAAFALGVGDRALPEDVFSHLEKLKELDLSNNQLATIPSNIFASLMSLTSLNLRDNALRSLSPTTFQSHLHPSLASVKLSVNRIGGRLETHAFHELNSLRHLYLDDNAVETIERSAFSSLNRLEYLDLSGNSIASLAAFSFQDLPTLEYLNLASNRLETFQLDVFDQVGTLAAMTVDVSHNRLQRLVTSSASSSSSYSSVNVNIRLLDLRHNNISLVHQDYFEPIKDAILELRLDHNNFRGNVSKTTFGPMPHLRVLNLDHNLIDNVDAESLELCPSLQSISVSHNRLTSLPPGLFARHASLRHLDLSSNQILELPQDFLRGTMRLERLKLAGNRISQFPEVLTLGMKVSGSGSGGGGGGRSSLRHLDLSHNRLRYLPKDEALKNALASLNTLNLAYNELKNTIELNVGFTLSSLRSLDLSGNPVLGLIDNNPLNLSGLSSSILEQLDLADSNLTALPSNLNLANVLAINLSSNNITSVTSLNAPQLRHLDLSRNRIGSVPVRLWPTIPRLVSLSLAYNPIRTVVNESFLGLNVLDELSMERLQAAGSGTVQNGIFLPLKNLRTVHVSPYGKSGLDLVHLTSVVDNLRNLHVYLDDQVDDDRKFAFRSGTSSTSTSLPSTLTSITVTGTSSAGRRALVFDKTSLEHLRNRNLHLTVTNTTITGLELGPLGSVRNLWLNVSHNGLVALADPSTTDDPNGRGVFLQRLDWSGNRWQCNCDIGWVEHWMRRFRQMKCRQSQGSRDVAQAEPDDDGDDDDPSVYRECQQTLAGLRLATCYNRGNKSVVDVLEEDLECGIASSGHDQSSFDFSFSFLVFFVFKILAGIV